MGSLLTGLGRNLEESPTLLATDHPLPTAASLSLQSISLLPAPPSTAAARTMTSSAESRKKWARASAAPMKVPDDVLIAAQVGDAATVEM